MEARVARLFLYPVKSLDGQEVDSATVLPNGALEHDRAFAFFDAEGSVVNAKRYAAIQRLRSRVDLDRRHLRLDDELFRFDEDRRQLEEHLGKALGIVVTLAEDRSGGFPDDPMARGPTVIGTATLQAIAGWFGLGLADARARFRANVEIDGVPPFWEDRMFGPGDEARRFTINDLRFCGTNPCLRCAVPARDPWSGTSDETFAKRFSSSREEHLPSWAPRDRFKPFYRVAVNTRSDEAGGTGTIRVGDVLSLEN